MKKNIMIITLLLIVFNAFSQIKFESGYFIDNNGEKVNCLIKNKDWENNPSEFEYKLSEDLETSIETIKNVKEFVTDNIKYERFTVLIDRSSSNINNYSEKKEPEFNEEQLFLKSIIEGKASLYYYRGKNITRFFYSVDSIKTEQLVYKDYLAYEQNKPYYLPTIKDNITDYSAPITGGKIIHRVNDKYRFQLLSNLKSKSNTRNDIYQTKYKTKDLSKIFIKYNESVNSHFIDYNKKHKGFKFSIKAGINYTSFSMNRTTNNYFMNLDADFDPNLNLRLGFEAEYILPFNQNKWSLSIEPTFQNYKANKEIYLYTFGLTIHNTIVYVDYKSIIFPFIVKYNIYLNDQSKLFINSGIVVDQSLNSTIYYERQDLDPFIIDKRILGFQFGLGYKYKNKYSIEFRHETNREIMGNYVFWNSYYRPYSLIIGYTL